MEQRNYRSGKTPPLRDDHAVPGGTYQRESFVESVLTDAALDELKKQSVNGCLLCSFDSWDGEEWD